MNTEMDMAMDTSSKEIIKCGSLKRGLINNLDVEVDQPRKVFLVERETAPSGITLVNAQRVAKKSHEELVELEQGLIQSDKFLKANARNKLDMIGRQMKSLQELMNDVLKETQLNNELNNAACNFVKRPGHIYHLYQRSTGQKYFGMLSPQEWMNAPHKYLGSYCLEADYSWTPVEQIKNKYEGIKFLEAIMSS